MPLKLKNCFVEAPPCVDPLKVLQFPYTCTCNFILLVLVGYLLFLFTHGMIIGNCFSLVISLRHHAALVDHVVDLLGV